MVSIDSSTAGLRRLGFRLGAGSLIFTAALVAGCQSKSEPSRPSIAPTVTNNAPVKSASIEAIIPENWLGRWNGPEGTFLEVSKSGDKYLITIQNLDGQRTFEATPAGD